VLSCISTELRFQSKCSMSKPVDFPVGDDWHVWLTGCPSYMNYHIDF